MSGTKIEDLPVMEDMSPEEKKNVKGKGGVGGISGGTGHIGVAGAGNLGTASGLTGHKKPTSSLGGEDLY